LPFSSGKKFKKRNVRIHFKGAGTQQPVIERKGLEPIESNDKVNKGGGGKGCEPDYRLGACRTRQNAFFMEKRAFAKIDLKKKKNDRISRRVESMPEACEVVEVGGKEDQQGPQIFCKTNRVVQSCLGV